ncbi:MAG: hypothetical protein LUQ36_01280 [Methanoregula sp.]|nr:hypothetical protein [Methanoregula sp.]
MRNYPVQDVYISRAICIPTEYLWGGEVQVHGDCGDLRVQRCGGGTLIIGGAATGHAEI